MLDIARDRVPTLESLFALVDRLSSWKLNQLQLYTEHTFAYVGHEEVWRHADPYTPDDLRAIDAHCRRSGVELVANQNTLGHFERWLRHERYRPLAIAPDGFEWVFGIHRSPMTLDPANPSAFALVTDLLDQIVPVVDEPAGPHRLGRALGAHPRTPPRVAGLVTAPGGPARDGATPTPRLG